MGERSCLLLLCSDLAIVVFGVCNMLSGETRSRVEGLTAITCMLSQKIVVYVNVIH
jgi:hypothetical protein